MDLKIVYEHLIYTEQAYTTKSSDISDIPVICFNLFQMFFDAYKSQKHKGGKICHHSVRTYERVKLKLQEF
jgi:inorganic pyrophosphatase